LNQTVNLAPGASQTFTVNATVAASATLSVSNTATVTAPVSTTDPSLGNNSATDTDNIVGPRPTLTVLDNFNRANANYLGGNWTQAPGFGTTGALRVNGNRGVANSSGSATWNVPSGGFGAKQAAAFTVANTTVDGDTLVLKANGNVLPILVVQLNYIRVRYSAGQVVVDYTTNYGASFTQTAAMPASLANGDTLTALANIDGSVDVWKTTGATTTYIGRSASVATFAGPGRIGMQLNTGAQVDDFAGGTVA
jgi:hypothetical protein